MKFTIESQWGSITNECKNVQTKIIFQGLKQLMFYWKNGNKTQYLKKDIQGYKALLDSKYQESNCDKFLYLKHERLKMGERFKDNMEVINYMKSNNFWKE